MRTTSFMLVLATLLTACSSDPQGQSNPAETCTATEVCSVKIPDWYQVTSTIGTQTGTCGIGPNDKPTTVLIVDYESGKHQAQFDTTGKDFTIICDGTVCGCEMKASCTWKNRTTGQVADIEHDLDWTFSESGLTGTETMKLHAQDGSLCTVSISDSATRGQP